MWRSTMPLLGLLAGVAWLPAQPVDGRAIIEKAIQAHGGADKLAKLNIAAVKVKGTAEFMDIRIQFTGQSLYQLPDKSKVTMELEQRGKKVRTIQVCDGQNAWMIVMDKIVDLEGEHLQAVKEDGYARQAETLVPLLKDKDYTLTVAGEQKVNGQPAIGIKVQAKGRKDIDFWFDKATGLLVKSARVSFDSNTMKPATFLTIYSDFKDFNGLRLASKEVITKDGEKYMEVEVLEIKPLEKIAAKEFARPL